ncbi:hypothetical protein F5Y17DRAFT_435479 [Xylariaceae sp. FL0594]|nr:hypothetical protein F5Y17DRAFT_435479 [Xylariaceae sp. FL0594]
MSLSNSLSVARASSHALSPRAPRVAALSQITSDATPMPLSVIASTTSTKALRAQLPRQVTSQPARAPAAPVWFTSSFPRYDPRRPDTERKVQLGKTLRILQERLPTLLESPLPQEILSPNISLHLFPSTHPHLPTVSGRVAYIAALWTSPIAWNRVPIVGNVRLEILSERMVTQPLHFSPRRPGAYGEQLVVKWRTASSKDGEGGDRDGGAVRLSLTEQGEQNLDAHLRGSQTSNEKRAFTGLFVFEFDKEGRILSHTIEHVDESGDWEKGVGARVVGLTDWLLGEIKGRAENGGGALPALFKIADKEPDRGLQ